MILVWPAHLDRSPLPITSSQMTHLWEALCAAYRIVGFESAAKRDNVFRDLVLARIIEPTSEIDADACSVKSVSHRRPTPPSSAACPYYAQPRWRQSLATASARRASLGPASLVLFDVSTLYFKTDTEDGFRESGYSNYAEVPVMPMPWWLWWCSCCSARLAGVVHAA